MPATPEQLKLTVNSRVPLSLEGSACNPQTTQLGCGIIGSRALWEGMPATPKQLKLTVNSRVLLYIITSILPIPRPSGHANGLRSGPLSKHRIGTSSGPQRIGLVFESIHNYIWTDFFVFRNQNGQVYADKDYWGTEPSNCVQGF